MAEIISYYMTDADSTAIDYVIDYSESGLERVAAAEEKGAILRAVYDDGTEKQVTASQVTNPNVGKSGSASIGVSYSAGAKASGLLMAQSLSAAKSGGSFTGSVTIGRTVLEFENGLLVAVSQEEGESNGYTE